MEAKEKYFRMHSHIQSVGFDRHIDMCVDSEQAYPLTEGDGEEYWLAMYDSMVCSVGIRLEQDGICASDYGIPY